ncbi:sigma-70 family RNA polymerase sigma factor [Clostridiaceae bacterium M8S5]|nr:sigma-70 family RNA polymerase sigma factor [Clostridiaceae bacterium M8S5]
MKLSKAILDAQKEDKQALKELYVDFYKSIVYYSKKNEDMQSDLTISFLDFILNLNPCKIKNRNNSQIAKYINAFLKSKSLGLLRKNNQIKTKECLKINQELLKNSATVDFASNLFICELLKELPVQQRRIVVRKYIYDLPDIEIAKQLKISRQAVNHLKNRALKNLRKYISSDGGEKDGIESNRNRLQTWYLGSIDSNISVLHFKKSRKTRY